MFTLLKLLPWRQILAEQMPALAASWLIAELFYKFHSFSLETAAFLLTWFVIDAVVQGIKRVLAPAASAGDLRPASSASSASLAPPASPVAAPSTDRKG